MGLTQESMKRAEERGEYLFILYLKLSPLAMVKSQNMNWYLQCQNICDVGLSVYMSK